MRRRLLWVSLSLTGALLLALMAPLLTTYAADRTQDAFVARLGDVTRFAVLAEDTLETGEADALRTDLERYVDVYGGSVLVVNANREVVVRAGSADVEALPGASDTVERSLRGAGSRQPGTVWPWSEDEMLIGSPVGRDAQVLGAVVMAAPTQNVQSGVLQGLAWMTLLGLVTVLVTTYGLVVPFVGWILRPVHDLDHAAKQLAGGDLSSRAHAAGPPELRDLATSFNAMVDSVETSQRQQRELVADAAHQLGNPLTALRLRVEGLTSAGAPEDAVEPVLEETERLSAIVDSLLRLSQVGAAPMVAEPVDVAAVVRHRCEMWSPVFTRLDVQTPPQAWAWASTEVVDVALDALLDNAAKFAADAPVTVRVVTTPGEVALWVRDLGPGLHPEDVAKVGSRFFRGRQHQNVPGTGLGLAIVRARLDDLDGTLSVHTPDDGGLAVGVRLPAAPTPQARSSR